MYKQGKITKKEYEDAMKESKYMKFVGYNQKKEKEDVMFRTGILKRVLNDLKKGVSKAE